MKKRMIALFVVSFFLFVCGIIPVSAESPTESEPELWVLTAPVPNSAIAKAYSLVSSLFGYPTGAPTDPDPNRPVTLGTPFWMAALPDTDGPTLCYFPILQDGKVCLTYRLSHSVGLLRRTWSGVGSAALVEELNGFIGDTSAANPLIIYLDENLDIVLQSEHNKKTVQMMHTRPRVPTSDKTYEELQAAPGQVSVNVIEQAKLVWKASLPIVTWYITVTFQPFRIGFDRIFW